MLRNCALRLARMLVVTGAFFSLMPVGEASAQSDLLTIEDVKRISPVARDDLARALADADGELAAAGIDTRLRMAHFVAQVMTETGGLERLDENMNYSFKTLMRVFSRSTVSEAKAREIAKRPKEVANWVYGARLGNRGRHTDDGWNYRGSGFIQLTGRDNFRARGREVGLPLEAEPERARNLPDGLTAAIAYWSARNINDAADDHDRRRVRILVNGPAAHGYETSIIWFNDAWIKVFRDKEALGFEVAEAEVEPIDEAAVLEDILAESGITPPSGFESGVERSDAIKEFQNEMGLEETGIIDEATKLKLLDQWRYRDVDEEEVGLSPVELEQTAAFLLNSSEAGPTPDTRQSGAAADATASAPERGSGELAADPGLTQDELRAFSEANAAYSQYEMGGADVAPETFVPFSVVGTDDRVPVNSTMDFPARAIVQILFEGPGGRESLCSGALISPDTVLTAAHCLHEGTRTGIPFSGYRVIPARNVGAAPFGRCGARESLVLKGWIEAATLEESRYYDLGALKLDCQIGERTGWLGVRALGNDEIGTQMNIQGYSARKAPAGKQWSSTGELELLWSLKGFHQNDTFGGTSGAPVLAVDQPAVVFGVHTNGLHGDESPWNQFNAFTRITPARVALIRSWMER